MFNKNKCKCTDDDCDCTEHTDDQNICDKCYSGNHTYFAENCQCSCECDETDITDKTHICSQCRNNLHVKSWTVWRKIEVPSSCEILARTEEEAILQAKDDDEWDFDYPDDIDDPNVKTYVAVLDDEDSS